MTIVHLIQRQIPLGSCVTFTLKTGQEVTGTLTEIGRDYVVIEENSGVATILVETIGSWKVSSAPATNSVTVPPAHKPVQAPSGNLDNGSIDESGDLLKEIKIRFDAYLETRRPLEIIAPSFEISDDDLREWQRSGAVTAWNRAKSKYEYALKVNELSGKFGRIQPIIAEIKTITAHYPSSLTANRLLAYMTYLSNDSVECAKLYEQIALVSREHQDWHNLAVIALERNQRELAHYSLFRIFRLVGPATRVQEWYWYTYLGNELGLQYQLAELIQGLGYTPSDDDNKLILNTAIYMLLLSEKSEEARDLLLRSLEKLSLDEVVATIQNHFTPDESASYQAVKNRFLVLPPKPSQVQREPSSQLRKGEIYRYLADRNYGFLRSDDGTSYFFHRTAIADDQLMTKLMKGIAKLRVTFEHTDGPKGPVAVSVSLQRTVDQVFELAKGYASDGEYPKAIAQIRKVLTLSPDYPGAQELHEKWRSYARITGVPQGSNPYARAKRVQLIEKDLERAVRLFKQAIQDGDNVESAIKDLASVYVQLGQTQNAIKVLTQHKSKIHDPQSVDNLLIGFYQKAEQYQNAVDLLRKQLAGAKTNDKKAHFLSQIGTCLLRQGDYVDAERSFREILNLQPYNQSAKRNIAICLFHQDRLDDAETLLNQILDVALDYQAAELLEAIRQARLTGRSAEIQIEMIQSISSSAVSELTEFFLERCDYQGVRADRFRDGRYDVRHAQADLQALERLAGELRTARPRERAGYYLSAAKIALLRDDNAPSDQFYKYLCRSFASTADGFLSEGRHLNAVQEMYCEALAVYDGDQSPKKNEQDAENSLVRFIASTLGATHIPRTPNIPTVDEVIEDILEEHPQTDKAFDALGYLTLRSRYAMDRVLRSLHKQVRTKSTFQAHLHTYMKHKGVSTGTHNLDKLDILLEVWKEFRRKKLDEYRQVSDGLRVIGEFEIKAASVENCIEQLKLLAPLLFFELDQDRFRDLSRLFNLILDLSKQDTFDDQERLCVRIKLSAQDLINEIENNPTKVSVEGLLPLVKQIIDKVNMWQENLYQSATPQLSLRVPVESYTPDGQDQIDVQVVIENRRGCSPAEALQLVVQEDRELFQVIGQGVNLEGSLRGGEQRILRVPIRVLNAAQASETFSLPVYAQYSTRSGDTDQTPVHSFSILLYSKDDFEEIRNPYAEYAEGGIVGNPKMFYGRGDLIARVATTIKESHSQSKCVVIYGQKRAGKSSVLHHLKKALETENVLALDIGNIGAVIDENSQVPLLYQILWSVLQQLKYAIEDRVDSGYDALGLDFPRDVDFFKHPSPLNFFVDIFEDFRRKSSRKKPWKDLRPVVLIDEFSYVYDQINKGRLSPEFMKNWKAILQQNFFNAVLVGQDVMPKFKERFPNEFGTTQDEPVSYLRPEDAIRLIDEPIRFGSTNESRYREKAIERILDLTAGSPFYIQILCNRLVQYMNRKRARLVTDADIEQIKQELITGANSLGKDKFDNLVSSGDTSSDAIGEDDILRVLAAIAVNSRTGPCNRQSIACETATPIDLILEDLVRRRVLERERGSYYRITVGLFKEWLIVHQG